MCIYTYIGRNARRGGVWAGYQATGNKGEPGWPMAALKVTPATRVLRSRVRERESAPLL